MREGEVREGGLRAERGREHKGVRETVGWVISVVKYFHLIFIKC